MIVRRAVDQDKEAVKLLLSSLGYEIHQENAFHSTWQEITTNPHMGILVAEENEKVLGYLAYSEKPQLRLGGKCLEIDELSVNPSHTGKGIGSGLVKELISHGRNKGVKRIVVSTNKKRENFQREFYPKQGFELKDSALFKMDLR